MDKINESWDPGVDDLREDNPLNRALSNLDDVRRSLREPEGVSDESIRLLDSLWDSLLNDARNWEDAHPETPEAAEEPARKVSVDTFRTMLHSDIVKFKFEKKDGTIRVAYGTLKSELIARIIGPYVKKDGVERKPRPDYLITYFDLEKETFRSFNKERFIGVVDEHAKVPVTKMSESKFVDFSTYTYIKEALDCDWGDECECECEEEE
jgi:hypothetical protein